MQFQTPFNYFILKVAGRCNLNCSYCYMYNLADQTWIDQPKLMSKKVIDACATKISGYCKQYNLEEVTISLHGGEPLLLRRKGVEYLVSRFRDCFVNIPTRLHFNMQTNGVLLDEEWISLLYRNGFYIGVSLDGPKAIHDLNRVDHKGRGSYGSVVKAIKLLTSSDEGSRIFGGVISVVDIRTDPVEMLEHHLRLGIKKMSFIFPDQNYEYRPIGKETSLEETPYGDWFIRLFDAWFLRDDPTIEIRLFKTFIGLSLGYRTSTDTYGASPIRIVVIETDGELEPLDVLKSAGHGVTKTGKTIFADNFDDLRQNKLVNYMLNRQQSLSPVCQECKFVKVCGGGYLPHRYSAENGFNNPSIYCSDLYKLIAHIQERVGAVLSPAL